MACLFVVYGAEVWTWTKRDVSKLQMIKMKFLQKEMKKE